MNRYFNRCFALNKVIHYSNIVKARIYVILAAISAVFEVIIIGVAYDIVSYILNKEDFYGYFIIFLNFIIEKTSLPGIDAVILPAFLLIFFISYSLRSYVLHLNLKISYAFGADISRAIFKNTIEKLKKDVRVRLDDSEIITQVTSKANLVVEGLYSPIFTALSSISVALAIGTYLLYIAFYQTLVIFFISLIYYAVISHFSRRAILQNGVKINWLSTRITKKTQDLLNYRNEILIYSSLANREAEFGEMSKNFSILKSRNAYLAQSPRIFLEAIIILSAVVGVYAFSNGNYLLESETIVVIFATLRMLPIFQQFYFMISTMRANEDIVDSVIQTLAEDLQDPSAGKYEISLGAAPTLWRVLKFKNIRYVYPDGNQLRFDLEILGGRVNVIVGQSGSGKSTLLDLLVGCSYPSSGAIIIDGEKIERFDSAWRSSCGFVSQNPSLNIVSEYLIGKGCRDDFDSNLFQSNLEVLDLRYTAACVAARLVDANNPTFSTGETRRIALAFAYSFRDVKLMLLDEVTSGLSIETRKVVRNFILARHMTCVLVSHLAEDSDIAEKIVRVNR